MTSNRFFIKQKSLDAPYIFLDGDEHHHLSRVARIKPKEKVWLFDEQGTRYLARVEDISKGKTRLLILEKRGREEPRVRITLAQALIRSKKMDFVVQKATELGVVAFIPVVTARSIIKVEERVEKKIQRWKRIAREASKQSKVFLLNSIVTPQPLERVILESTQAKKLLLSENRGKYLREILIQGWETHEGKPPSSVLILVGPEGGWTDEEEDFILDQGFEAVSLGNQILRAETAALCALALISHFWNS